MKGKGKKMKMRDFHGKWREKMRSVLEEGRKTKMVLAAVFFLGNQQDFKMGTSVNI